MFVLRDGASVLAPVGAFAPHDTFTIDRQDGISEAHGAVEISSVRYVLSTSGSVRRPLALQIAIPAGPGETKPVGVSWDAQSQAWQPVNSDFAKGALVLYLPRAGVYTWARWSWPAAGAIAVRTLQATIRQRDAGDLGALCAPSSSPGTDVTASLVAETASRTIRWCTGADGTELSVGNGGTSPLTLRVTGADPTGQASGGAVFDELAGLARRIQRTTLDGFVLAPGEVAQFYRNPDAETRIALTPDPLSRTVGLLHAAFALTVGLQAGSTEIAATMLADPALTRALLDDVATPACTALIAAASLATASPHIEPIESVVRGCVSKSTLDAVASAAGRIAPLRRAGAPDTLPPFASLFTESALDALTGVLAAGADEVVLPALHEAEPSPPTPPSPAAPSRSPSRVPTVSHPTTPPQLPGLVLSAGECTKKSGALAVRASGLTPGGRYQADVTGEHGRATTTQGTANADGAAAWSFACPKQQGTWSMVVRDDTTGATSHPVSFATRH